MDWVIDKMAEVIRERNINVYALSETRDGETRTITLREDCSCRDVYSVSKAYTMAAVGFLFDEGKITPETTVKDVFGPLPEGSVPRWSAVTVRDALRHETGLLNGDVDIDSKDLPDSSTTDWLKYLFSLPLEGTRGEDYKYTDAAYYLLSRMVAKISGEEMFPLLRKKLFVPLRFTEYAWSTCPLGYSAGGSGLFVSCEDMTKLATLFLNKGVFEGKRILSEEWVNLAVQNNFAFSPRSEHKNGYYKTGAHGQIVYFCPEENFSLGIQSYVTNHDTAPIIDLFL